MSRMSDFVTLLRRDRENRKGPGVYASDMVFLLLAEIDRLVPREAELLEASNRYLAEARIARAAARGGFQGRVDPWLLACFGEAIARDGMERSHRFIEEALELIQACGATASEAHQLVDYVFGRETGDKSQEVGGVMVTLAALCLAHNVDMAEAGETELARIWTKVEQIRAKQAAKPRHGPLPEHVYG